MTSAAASRLTLNNGVSMPAVGLGVHRTPPAETADAVRTALLAGYRLIDTAAAYGNEREVGAGIRGSGVRRDDVFIETKVWISDYGYDATMHAFDKAAGKLGVDQIDLLMLHEPLPTAFDLTIGSYQALETLVADGAVRAIGVCNFTPEQLTILLNHTDVLPALNQIELHPYFRPMAALSLHARRGVATQACSPLGGVASRRHPDQGAALTDPTILEIASSHRRSAAQVVLRWHLQEGRAVVLESVGSSRNAENVLLDDFELTATELARMDALNTGSPSGPDSASITVEADGWPIAEA
jgi:diketogulonate reductase-like aldo/keto reductase